MMVIEDPNFYDYFGEYVLSRAVREGEVCHFEVKKGLLQLLDPAKFQFLTKLAKEKMQGILSGVLNKDVKTLGESLRFAPSSDNIELIETKRRLKIHSDDDYITRLVNNRGEIVDLRKNYFDYFRLSFKKPLFYLDPNGSDNIGKNAVYFVDGNRIRGLLMLLLKQ